MSPQRTSPHAEPMHSSTNYAVVEYLRGLLRGQTIIREAHPITLDNSEPEPDIAVVAIPPYAIFYSPPLSSRYLLVN
ncbi:MAG: hypothetical protein AAGM29_07210 [Cyanobacteria bacterium J06588_4]